MVESGQKSPAGVMDTNWNKGLVRIDEEKAHQSMSEFRYLETRSIEILKQLNVVVATR